MRLSVSYKLSDKGSRDEEVEAIVGCPPVAAGCFIPTGTRDMEFLLSTEEEATAAKARLEGVGFDVALQ
jgi:hypothetical protein